MSDIQAIKEYLATPKKVVITTHANPDADALGSSLGLCHFLNEKGHHATVIVPNSYPDFLEWMPGNTNVINFEESEKQATELINNCNLLFCLDFSVYSRIKGMSDVASNAGGKVALIDHHLNPEIRPDFNFWDDTAAATSELIFDFIVALEGKNSISQDMAECLYAGIMTDTGSFRHASTSSKIHRTVADLIDLGVNVNKVSRLIYETNSLNRLKFIGYSLVEKLKVLIQYQVAYFVIEENDFRKFNLKQGDTEGLVNYALSVNGIALAAIIIESGDEIKMSFRSVGDYEVNTFAKKYFKGGGHKNAAGGSSSLNLLQTEERFLALINQNVLKSKI